MTRPPTPLLTPPPSPIKRLFAAALALLGAWAAPPASAAPDDGPSTLTGIAGALRPLRLPPEVRRQADIAYGSDPRQRLDAYLPAQSPPAPASAPAPIIVMVHGGAWMFGNKAMSQVVENKVVHWVAAPPGAIFVSVGYRLAPQAGPMEQAEDVAHAVARVQALAPSWGGDAGRIVLMGHSAGAHLVALLGASPTLAAAAGARPWLGTVVLDSAALDLTALMRAPHARFYDRVFGRDPALWRAASPSDALSADAPPLLLACSRQRPDHSCAQAEAFAARARALGVRAAVSAQDLSHGEVNSTLGLPGDETRAVDAFLDSVGWRAR